MNLTLVLMSALQLLGAVKAAVTGSQHTNNWVVLISTSKFWYNYRHMANTLGMYKSVKRLGVPDSNIILMLAEDIACNSRNPFPGAVFNNADKISDLYGEKVQVDYRGEQVTVENFIRLLSGRLPYNTPSSKQLLSDEHSNVLVYMTGHGGNKFLKFQDVEELDADELADAFQQMWERKRYRELLFIIDTCQANTLYSKFYSPNLIAIGSSAVHESSYSHHSDYDIGVAVIDRFTYYTLEFLEKHVRVGSNHTLADLYTFLDPELLLSHPGIRTDLISRPLDQIRVTDFFGHVPIIEKNTRDTNEYLPFNASALRSSNCINNPKRLAYFRPENNGGTVLSISGKDYCLICSDTRHINGYSINSRYAPRCYEVGDGIVVGATGCDGDAKQLIVRIQQSIEWYHYKHNKPISVKACARMVQGMLYGKRFFPYYAYVLVCGLDERGIGSTYAFDPVGSYERVVTKAVGAASLLVVPFLDNQVSLKNQYMAGVERIAEFVELDKAINLSRDAFISATERQIQVGDKLEFKVIRPNGITTMIFDLKRD